MMPRARRFPCLAFLRRTTLPVLAGVSLLLAVGCAANVHYQPRWPLGAPATKFLTVEVVNGRAPDKGGDDITAVGILRGGYGNPMTFTQDNPGDLPRLVHMATVDALHGAGIDVRDGAPTKLVAKILQF